MEVRHGLCTFDVNFFPFLYWGKLPALHLFSLLYLSFFFNRQTQHSLSSEGDSPPAKKKKKNTRSGAGNAAYTPCFCSQASKLLPDQTYQLFWGVEENIKLFFPQLSLCPSRFLISKLATKAHHCWKHPRALNTDVSKLRSPC